MLVPFISKTLQSKGEYVERTLPVPGQILLTENTEVAPYQHVGICTFSQKLLKLPANFKPNKFKKDGQFYYYNNVLGKQGKNSLNAPYNGNLFKVQNDGFEFREEVKKYILLSGVWGNVVKTVEKNSVLIQTNMTDINLVASTKSNFAGELVVFPNPTRLLERFYLEGFASDSADGKIVYVGNHVSLDFLKDATKYGIGAIIGGSADKEAMRYATDAGINFGIFSGFGDIATPEAVYNLLNSVSNRYVFFQGERNLLRIPMPKEDQVVSIKPEARTHLVEVAKGMSVLLLQKPHFGESAIVDSVGESSIFVKFGLNENPIEVFVPNFFVLKD
jgi:hypothetical protein